MPIPWKVNGNSKWEGGFKSPIFGMKVWHSHSCTTPLAKWCVGWSRPRRLIRCPWASTGGWTSDLVPPHGDLALRKMANPSRQCISRHSTSMPNAKLTTHTAHSIRQVPYPAALRRLSLTVGTATTVFPFTQTTTTSPPSSPHGGDTDTKWHPRGT